MIASSMLQPSFSTIIMAVLTTNAFLIVLSLCLINEKLLIHAGHRLLALFALFTTLRFVLPIELPFTITIKFSEVVSQIVVDCHNRLFQIGEQPISLWMIFKAVWLVGFIIGLLIHIISYYRSNRLIILYGKELTHTAPYKELLDKICESKGRANHFRVIELPGLDVPALFGIIHPRILIPENLDLPQQQLTYILQHEATHHFKHDILLKNIIKLISLAYWWDIFSWLLNRQSDIILEMRIDHSLTGSNATITQEYMQCLLEMSERTSKKRMLPDSFAIGFLPSGYKALKRRFQLMVNNQKKSQTGWNILLIIMAVTIYLFSYTIVLEGYVAPEEYIPQDSFSQDSFFPEDYEIDDLVFPTAENSYFIDNLDGTYSLYMNGKLWETVDSLDYYYDDIPVYTQDTAPQ